MSYVYQAMNLNTLHKIICCIGPGLCIITDAVFREILPTHSKPMMNRQGVGHKKTVGDSTTCTPPRKIRPQFLGRVHTLLIPSANAVS